MAGKLIVGSMPIGNIDDITVRMIKSFQYCDIIFSDNPSFMAEQILKKYNIQKEIIILNSENSGYADENQIALMENYIENNKSVLLISSEGQVAISDPGVQFIQRCIAKKLNYEVLPGPSSSVTSFVYSGLSSGRLFMHPTVEGNDIEQKFSQIKNISYPVSVHVWSKDLDRVLSYINSNFKWQDADGNVIANKMLAICCNMSMDNHFMIMDWCDKIAFHKDLFRIDDSTLITLVFGDTLHLDDCDHHLCNSIRSLV
jgi:16S rRNA (cytidine(1402)-2'-O)-methyltransferase